jgi:cell division protein FtsW (lipid II flippase)
MRMQYLFYAIGIFFLFATVAYFSYNFLFNLSDGIKTIILILLVVLFFVAGDIMEDKEL